MAQQGVCAIWPEWRAMWLAAVRALDIQLHGGRRPGRMAHAATSLICVHLTGDVEVVLGNVPYDHA